jgi:hypothetical protein
MANIIAFHGIILIGSKPKKVVLWDAMTHARAAAERSIRNAAENK